MFSTLTHSPHRFGRPVLSRNKRIHAQNPNPLPKGERELGSGLHNLLFFSVTSVAKFIFLIFLIFYPRASRVPRGKTVLIFISYDLNLNYQGTPVMSFYCLYY